MSVHISSWVWKHSWHSGSDLLILLAMADMANDEGLCWPSVATLCERGRMSERNVQYSLRKLEDSGSITTVQRRGRASHYYVQTEGVQPIAPVQSNGEGVQPIAPPGATAIAPEPSGTVIENHQATKKAGRRTQPVIRAAAPEEFSEFDRMLTAAFGAVYIPTADFWHTIFSEFRHLPLNAEAVKMTEYRRTHSRWPGTIARVLTWLSRAKVEHERQQGSLGREYRGADRAETGPFDRDFRGRPTGERSAD